MKERNPQQVDYKVLKFLVPVLLITTAVMYFNFSGQDEWTTGKILSLSICAALSLLLLFTLFNQEVFWWAPRIIALMLFLSVAALTLFIIINDIELNKKHSLGLALSMFVVGIPSLMYVLWGDSGGKSIRDISEIKTPNKAFSVLTSSIVTMICLIASIILGGWLIFNTLVE